MKRFHEKKLDLFSACDKLVKKFFFKRSDYNSFGIAKSCQTKSVSC